MIIEMPCTLYELSLRDIAKAVDMQAPALDWHFKII